MGGYEACTHHAAQPSAASRGAAGAKVAMRCEVMLSIDFWRRENCLQVPFFASPLPTVTGALSLCRQSEKSARGSGSGHGWNMHADAAALKDVG